MDMHTYGHCDTMLSLLRLALLRSHPASDWRRATLEIHMIHMP